MSRPDELLQKGIAFWSSRALLSALDLELFSTLAQADGGAMTNAEIQKSLNLDQRALPDFTDTLVSLHLLEREGDGETARYKNTKETACFLVKGCDTFIDELETCSRVHYQALSDLEDILKNENKEWIDYSKIKDECINTTNERFATARNGGKIDGNEDLSALHLIEIGFGFWPSRILLTATELGLFCKIKEAEKECMTVAQVSEDFNLQKDKAAKFLDALLSFNLLQIEGEGDTASFSNTPETNAYLQKTDLTNYLGGFFEMCSHRLYRIWAALTEALKTGETQNEGKDAGSTNLFDVLYGDQHRLERFVKAMMGISAYDTKVFANTFDFSRYTKLVDVGGSSGLLSSLVASKHTHMSCISLDLPAIVPIAKKFIEDWGTSDRVTADSCDFFTDDFPKADVVIMARILHDWGLKNKMMLIRKAFDALSEGGAFVAIESIIDDERRQNSFGLLMSLNMLIETGKEGGFDYSHADFNKWCLDVGFKRTEVLHLIGPSSAVIAYK